MGVAQHRWKSDVTSKHPRTSTHCRLRPVCDRRRHGLLTDTRPAAANLSVAACGSVCANRTQAEGVCDRDAEAAWVHDAHVWWRDQRRWSAETCARRRCNIIQRARKTSRVGRWAPITAHQERQVQGTQGTTQGKIITLSTLYLLCFTKQFGDWVPQGQIKNLAAKAFLLAKKDKWFKLKKHFECMHINPSFFCSSNFFASIFCSAGVMSWCLFDTT